MNTLYAEFLELCGRFSIEPNIALENENVTGLLADMKTASDDNARTGYRNTLIRVFETEF